MIRTNKELFNYIDKLRRSASGESFHEQRYAALQPIIIEDKQVFSVYIIKSGIVKCYLTIDTGKKFIQEFFGEGELFGEIETINNNYSFCTIEAINAVTVYKIQKEDFLKLLEEDKIFNRLFIKALTQKLTYKGVRHAYNQSHTIEDNLLRLRADFPDLEQIIAKQDIADYLGITLRALNRTIKNLTG